MHRGSRCFWGGRLPCHRTLQTTCLEHFQSWDWPSSQATCKGQLALLLNKRDVRKQKTRGQFFHICLNYFWETPCELWKCVKGKVIADVGQDLGGGSPGSWEHAWLWVAEKNCCSQMLSAGYQQMRGNEWCWEDFSELFLLLCRFLFSLDPESWMNWGLIKGKIFFCIFYFIGAFIWEPGLGWNGFLLSKHLDF